MTIITDPWFYVFAIPAVLITGISKSGFGGGAGGVAVPLMSQVIAPSTAAGIMLPILCVMDMLGIGAYRRQFSWALLRPSILPAIIGIALGALLFGVLSANATKLLLGVISVSFALYQWLPQLKNIKGFIPEALRPWVWCSMAGLTSTIAHAGGPPFMIYLWPKQLDRVRFVATSVMFFTLVNAVKLIPFAALGQLNFSNLGTALILMPLAPLGTWLGVRLNNYLSDASFRRIMLALMFVLGLRLLYEGLK